jgi:predicted restriction endonuclease
VAIPRTRHDFKKKRASKKPLPRLNRDDLIPEEDLPEGYRQKSPPLVDPEFRRFIVSVIGRCEWPGGCRSKDGLDPAHIRAKGMGGGFCEDTPINIMAMCRKHHDVYDHGMGQGRGNQKVMRDAIKANRSDAEWQMIRAEWRKRHPGLDAAGRRTRAT